MIVLAIDPGREKCGIAVIDSETGVLVKEITASASIGQRVNTLYNTFKPNNVILGDGTNSRTILRVLDIYSQIKIELFDEKNSTMLARMRYFKDNPPKGLRKLIPITMQTPPVNIDDYAAIILAESFIESLNPQNRLC